MELDTKVQFINGVGPKSAVKFAKLGIETVKDLLLYYPRKYLDYTTVTKISDIARMRNEGSFTVKGEVISIASKKTRRRGFTVTEAVIADGTGSIKVVWFNQPFLAKMIRIGSTLILNGPVKYDPYSQDYVMESPARASKPKIVPIYGETAGMSTYYIEKLINSVFSLVEKIEEWLPSKLIQNSKIKNQGEGVLRDGQLEIVSAIRNIHQPKNSEALEQARERLAFDELFLISLRANLAKEQIKKSVAAPIKISNGEIKQEIDNLPFGLTGDQEKALNEILEDMKKPTPMSRLLNGDVGSGKTVVAALAAFAAARAGMKTLFMVPTEILATQHYNTLCKLFGDQLSIGLKTSDRQDIHCSIAQLLDCQTNNSTIEQLDNCDVVVGTQALIQKGVEFENVGLVIVDEQHRFGVKQRAALQSVVGGQSSVEDSTNHKRQTTDAQKMRPHFLSMTATPIPRTLHLALFGDLDLSLIKEKPANRKEIKTRFVEDFNRGKAYEFIRQHLNMGRQAFIICPLIEEKGETQKAKNLFEEERKAVVSELEKVKNIFPEFNIEMLHGKLKSADKDKIMERFNSNEVQILVSTSVVEVGVDVPNANIMIIEDAERFGLAQIHQFRGRVGRGEHQSFCFLFSNSMSEKALGRLRSLEQVADGFKLAEIDLETRGPGAVFGTEQSGMLDLKMASLSDRELIVKAGRAAKEIVPEIEKYPLLLAKINQFEMSKHLE